MGLEDLDTTHLAVLADRQYSSLAKLKDKLAKIESKACKITCDDLRS